MTACIVTFRKTEPVRWLSHLDLLRAFERAVRRAGLPVSYTAGFNPRARLVFASALSTGVTGDGEVLGIHLEAELAMDEAAARLTAVLPPGISIVSCTAMPAERVGGFLNGFTRAEYQVFCDVPPGSFDALCRALESVQNAAELPIERIRQGKSRRVDVRPWLYRIAAAPAAKDRAVISATVGIGEGGAAKPNEIVQLLAERGAELTPRKIHRVRLIVPEVGQLACEE
ncbi:MAG: TIGR03936 family radical SAM-associated protein [Armatimonadetes bacterium]|nr:TIGR03936 family radical SAM-associated protein [Armatimonadota bacterium]MDE2207968.1 TIGR03936 family radical SAM-associated protein [Armatimonadota bacterium]